MSNLPLARWTMVVLIACAAAGAWAQGPVVITDVQTSSGSDAPPGGTEDQAQLPFEWPQNWLGGVIVRDTANQPRTVPDSVELSRMLYEFSRLTREWMTEAQGRLDELETKNRTLEQQVESLISRIAALESQQPGGPHGNLAALEARIAELERSKGTVTAPFQVVDTSGFPLVLVDENAATFTIPGGGSTNIALKSGHQPQIYLGNQAGGMSMEAGETSRISIQSGDTALFELRQDAAQGIVMTGKSAEGGFELGSGPGMLGLLVRKGDQPAAGLGTFDGRGIALRVFAASGQTIGAMGENPTTAGTGLVYVGNGSQNAAALAVADDGSGIVHTFAADGTVGAGMIGADRMVAAYNAAGNAVVTMGKSENSEGGNVTSRDPNGDGVFRAGYNSAVTGGDACVYRAKRQNVFCVGIGAPGMGMGGAGGF